MVCIPKIYLSPSTQENNIYVSGGSEEYYANLIADALVKYLSSSGIQFVRNSPEMNAAAAIAQSNSIKNDLHLAIHTNAAPPDMYGALRGIDVYYYPTSVRGKRAAEIFARNLKAVYPLPSNVQIKPTTQIGEVAKTNSPSVFLELGYHDNKDDALWIKSNIENIARNIALSLTEYFGIPFAEPTEPKTAAVNIASGNLNLRSRPDTSAYISARMPKGASLTVLGKVGDWSVVNYRGMTGYALSRYLVY